MLLKCRQRIFIHEKQPHTYGLKLTIYYIMRTLILCYDGTKCNYNAVLFGWYFFLLNCTPPRSMENRLIVNLVHVARLRNFSGR